MNLTDIREVKTLQADIRQVFSTPQGESVLKFMESTCYWYESVFDPVDRDLTLLHAGSRQVLATIKTFLKNTPEEIVALIKAKEA